MNLYKLKEKWFDIFSKSNWLPGLSTIDNIFTFAKKNILISGETGVGKSVIVADYLSQLDMDKYSYTIMNFSAQTNTKNVLDVFLDKDKFTNIDNSFNPANHTLQLADGTRTSGLVTGRGNAKCQLSNAEGVNKQVTLKNALLVPSFRQNIFSVNAATKQGASVIFTPTESMLTAPDGEICDIQNKYNLISHVRSGGGEWW